MSSDTTATGKNAGTNVTLNTPDTLKIRKPLVVVDGKEMTWQQFEKNQPKPEQIESMNVMKGETATKKYGEKAKDGAIEITSKGHNSEQGKYIKDQQQHLIEKQQFMADKQKHMEAIERHKAERQQQAKFEQQFNKEFSKAENETPAQFPGGADAWRRYLEKNLNANIPAKKGAPRGDYPVVLEFDVNKDGEISNITAQSKNGFGTEEEAIRIIRLGPKWVPAKKDGLSIASKVRQTITFRVSES